MSKDSTGNWRYTTHRSALKFTLISSTLTAATCLTPQIRTPYA